jgi:hypothetical protein
LLDVQGRIRAYACGRCGHVHAGTASRLCIPDDRVAEWIAAQARSSHGEAERCCTCDRCSAPLVGGATFGLCPTCKPIEEARIATIHLEMAESANQRALTLAHAKDEDAALRLVALMRDLSEETYSAGWLSGLEHMLWRLVQGGTAGVFDPDDASVDLLRGLSEQAGGWWRWDKAMGGEVFVPMAEWLALVAATEAP